MVEQQLWSNLHLHQGWAGKLLGEDAGNLMDLTNAVGIPFLGSRWRSGSQPCPGTLANSQEGFTVLFLGPETSVLLDQGPVLPCGPGGQAAPHSGWPQAGVRLGVTGAVQSTEDREALDTWLTSHRSPSRPRGATLHSTCRPLPRPRHCHVNSVSLGLSADEEI